MSEPYGLEIIILKGNLKKKNKQTNKLEWDAGVLETVFLSIYVPVCASVSLCNQMSLL